MTIDYDEGEITLERAEKIYVLVCQMADEHVQTCSRCARGRRDICPDVTGLFDSAMNWLWRILELKKRQEV